MERVEVPRVELDVDGAGADDPDEVGHEEGQEDGVGVPGAVGDGGVLVLGGGEELPVQEVGRCCSGWEGEDQGGRWPEEQVDQEGVEGGQGEQQLQGQRHQEDQEVALPSQASSPVLHLKHRNIPAPAFIRVIADVVVILTC